MSSGYRRVDPSASYHVCTHYQSSSPCVKSAPVIIRVLLVAYVVAVAWSQKPRPLLGLLSSRLSAVTAAEPLFNVNLMEDVKNKPIPTLVSELTQKVTGEFDKLYHQLEGVLGNLKEGWAPKAVETELDPETLSQCSCYCRCPHDTANPRALDLAEVKSSVLELKRKVEDLGNSLKDKIHEFISQ